MYGGIVIDFWFPARRMIWRVQGERFHLLDTQDRVKDEVSHIHLEQEGITVIDLWVRDLETRPDYVLSLAWEGQEPPSPLKEF
jgi:very-short-patch-repair endonuclease